MFAHCAGILLLVLHAADSQGNKVETVVVPLGDTVNISCKISAEALARTMTWYKEGHNKNLCKIHQGEENLKGEKKCSSRLCNLIINNAQRNDSGVYACVVSQKENVLLMSRTRVIITETSKPNFSILVPSFLQDGLPKHDIPLLCFLFNVNPISNFVIWNINGKTYQDWMDVDMIDGKEAFTIWSLKLIPPEEWHPGMSYAYPYPGNRSDCAAVFTTGSVLKQEASQIKDEELS